MKEKYMNRAIELAKKGEGYVNPNPMVGAVIVKGDEIIGEGYHMKYGGLHAERNALANCTKSPKGATIYVTLEPCCHYGKTPPCTEAIIESGISKVVIGSFDPNPLVSGKGAKILREHGIEVYEGFLRDKCDDINKIFFHYIKTKTPYVVMKYAMTLDGKISTYLGESKWITSEEARKHVHMTRHSLAGIMVGVNTVIKDNPMLNCRLEKGNNPVRIICDSNLRTPLESNIVSTAKKIDTIIATCSNDETRKELYRDMGCLILDVKKKDNVIDLVDLMNKLGEKGIDSILLEGGSTLNWSALNSKIVNEIQAYIAPKIFGGIESKSPIGGLGIDLPSNCFKLTNTRITQIGPDILIESEVIN